MPKNKEQLELNQTSSVDLPITDEESFFTACRNDPDLMAAIEATQVATELENTDKSITQGEIEPQRPLKKQRQHSANFTDNRIPGWVENVLATSNPQVNTPDNPDKNLVKTRPVIDANNIRETLETYLKDYESTQLAIAAELESITPPKLYENLEIGETNPRLEFTLSKDKKMYCSNPPKSHQDAYRDWDRLKLSCNPTELFKLIPVGIQDEFKRANLTHKEKQTLNFYIELTVTDCYTWMKQNPFQTLIRPSRNIPSTDLVPNEQLSFKNDDLVKADVAHAQFLQHKYPDAIVYHLHRFFKQTKANVPMNYVCSDLQSRTAESIALEANKNIGSYIKDVFHNELDKVIISELKYIELMNNQALIHPTVIQQRLKFLRFYFKPESNNDNNINNTNTVGLPEPRPGLCTGQKL